MGLRSAVQWLADNKDEELTLGALAAIVESARSNKLSELSVVRVDVRAEFASPARVKRLVVGQCTTAD